MIQMLGPLVSLASSWIEGKVEKTKANAAAEVALKNAEAIVYERKATAEVDWDLEAIKGAQNSWKDEWLCVLFSIPMIMAFIPGLEGVVARGFEQLEMMPDWYQYSLGVIIAASFGIRGAARLFRK
tara:strand:+ start:3148 stop:3525 length:378 start_codon:yes stop_codon:yes gene_type:complete